MTVNYDEYILSRQWQALAAETKRLAGNRCQVCNSDGELHAHHRTYERLGHELQSDLVALCGNCHALFHGKHDVTADKNGWALVKSLTAALRTAQLPPRTADAAEAER